MSVKLTCWATEMTCDNLLKGPCLTCRSHVFGKSEEYIIAEWGVLMFFACFGIFSMFSDCVAGDAL